MNTPKSNDVLLNLIQQHLCLLDTIDIFKHITHGYNTSMSLGEFMAHVQQDAMYGEIIPDELFQVTTESWVVKRSLSHFVLYPFLFHIHSSPSSALLNVIKSSVFMAEPRTTSTSASSFVCSK